MTPYHVAIYWCIFGMALQFSCIIWYSLCSFCVGKAVCLSRAVKYFVLIVLLSKWRNEINLMWFHTPFHFISEPNILPNISLNHLHSLWKYTDKRQQRRCLANLGWKASIISPLIHCSYTVFCVHFTFLALWSQGIFHILAKSRVLHICEKVYRIILHPYSIDGNAIMLLR